MSTIAISICAGMKIIKWKRLFRSLKPLVDVDGRSKFCLKSGSRATQEALFNVEKYCDTCAEKEAK